MAGGRLRANEAAGRDRLPPARATRLLMWNIRGRSSPVVGTYDATGPASFLTSQTGISSLSP
jgi:hypothetical protein